MKTKKIELLVASYGLVKYFLPFVVVVLALIIGMCVSMSISSLLVIFVVSAVLIFIGLKSANKIQDKIFQALLEQYKKHLRAKIAIKEWKILPTKEELGNWNAGFISTLDDYPKKLWITNFHANHKNSGQWKEVLKDVYVPAYSIYSYSEKGVSLYDIETCESLDFACITADTDLESLSNDQKKFLFFLKRLPMKDLLKSIQSSICPCFNPKTWNLLMLREGNKQDFEALLEAIYTQKVHICLTESVVDSLISYVNALKSKGKATISVAKTLMRKILLFLAYYVSIKADTIKKAKRMLVFQFLLDQQAKYFITEARLLLSYWPIFSSEEIEVIKQIFKESDAMILFANKEMWSQLSDSHLKQIFVEYAQPTKAYSWIKEIKDPTKFLNEVANRWN